MEKNIAILMSDLTGYTAMTETHGPHTAADLIDTYLDLVNESLAGDCELHQRVGDEVVIISSSPACILSTAVSLLKNAQNRHLFLQLHGGLHYGKILYRKGSYFGTTINQAARITASAPPGRFYCSSDFISSLQENIPIEFIPQGKKQFKNLKEEMELYELSHGGIEKSHIDPVCRMLVCNEEVAVSFPGGSQHYFCSEQCRQAYLSQD